MTPLPPPCIGLRWPAWHLPPHSSALRTHGPCLRTPSLHSALHCSAPRPTSPTLIQPPLPTAPCRRLIKDLICLLLTIDGDLDDRARGDPQEHLPGLHVVQRIAGRGASPRPPARLQRAFQALHGRCAGALHLWAGHCPHGSSAAHSCAAAFACFLGCICACETLPVPL